MPISIIIPVYKEEANINQTIENIYKQDKDIEIIVADSEENFSTLKAIIYDKVKKIKSPKGRSLQMNEGSKQATGDILLFLHADTILPLNAFKNIISVMNNHNVTAGAFNLSINSQRSIFRLIEKISSFRSNLTKIPYGDQAIFIRREYFESTGRYKEYPLMEEVELMQRLKKDRRKIRIIKDKVQTSSRRWEKEGIIYCTLRNWLLIISYFLGVSPEKLVKLYK